MIKGFIIVSVMFSCFLKVRTKRTKTYIRLKACKPIIYRSKYSESSPSVAGEALSQESNKALVTLFEIRCWAGECGGVEPTIDHTLGWARPGYTAEDRYLHCSHRH